MGTPIIPPPPPAVPRISRHLGREQGAPTGGGYTRPRKWPRRQKVAPGRSRNPSRPTATSRSSPSSPRAPSEAHRHPHSATATATAARAPPPPAEPRVRRYIHPARTHE